MTKEEKLMYEVMKSIYESGIPIDFKGSMVLKACLIEAGFHEEIRHTVDIDANWYSDLLPTAEQMTSSLQKALDKSCIRLKVKICRMYGEGRSAGFELRDQTTGEILFTIDMDVNRSVISTKVYEIAEMRFRGATVDQMLADKISVVSGDRVFRRIKDVVDLYYMSKAFPFHSEDVLLALRNSGREVGLFQGFLHRKDDLRHAYDKFRFTGDINKLPFDDIYDAVKSYICELFPKEEKV